MQRVKATMAFAMALPILVPTNVPASSHREAPITALDHYLQQSAGLNTMDSELARTKLASLAKAPMGQ